MTDISELVQKIKTAAEKATPGKWTWWTSNSFLRLSSDATAKDGGVIDSYRMTDGHTSLRVSKADQDFIALCFPENITVIIDALEKKQESNEFLKGQLSELANFNPDWDKLEACYGSWREIAAELLVAKERIAELEVIRAAAEKLVRCKGRYHSEQNYRALAAMFGVTVPELPPLSYENREDLSK